MTGLNTVFKQVFGEALKEQGFVKVKGRQPYFARLIKGEILHVIACRQEWSGWPKPYKEFGILAGVATVYRPEFNFSCCPRDNMNWLYPINYWYRSFFPSDWKEQVMHQLGGFRYDSTNENSLKCELDMALKETEKYILPVLDRVVDLETCIEYFIMFESPVFGIPEYNMEKDAFVPENDPENEGLLYIQADNHDDLKREMKKLLENKLKGFDNGAYRLFNITSEELQKGIEEDRCNTIKRRDRIYNNPIAYARALEELQRRKVVNLEVLKNCGLDIE